VKLGVVYALFIGPLQPHIFNTTTIKILLLNF